MLYKINCTDMIQLYVVQKNLQPSQSQQKQALITPIIYNLRYVF